jgi:phosphotransferase system HPr (HPr) family protein
MAEIHVHVVDPAGLHARPAARFVQVASRFASRISIQVGEREADAKSLIAVLGLTVRPGTEITIRAAGDDAELALAGLLAELEPFIAPTPTGAGDPTTAPATAPR